MTPAQSLAAALAGEPRLPVERVRLDAGWLTDPQFGSPLPLLTIDMSPQPAGEQSEHALYLHFRPTARGWSLATDLALMALIWFAGSPALCRQHGEHKEICIGERIAAAIEKAGAGHQVMISTSAGKVLSGQLERWLS